MLFSYNWLQSFFDRKLPAPKKLAELLTLHFAEVEETKRYESDSVLEIDVRPNRAADCFSHIGVAREIAAITNYKLLIKNSELKIKNFVNINVDVKHLQACPRYMAAVADGVKVGASPKWLESRLKACGLRPINNIVDIANYVMLETGQPLHAFDLDKLAGRKIIVRFAAKGEQILTLDGQKFELSPDILVIADETKPAAIAGIKGGKEPEIDNKTKTIIFESANFNPQIIRRGSRKLGLKTDASLRFEHGLDPNLAEFAINRALALVQKVAGGKVQGLTDAYPQKVLPKTIKLDLDYVKSLLGVEIPEQKIKKILQKLGFKIENYKFLPADRQGKILSVTVPTFRLDVSLPEDLIEEIGRIYGYQKIAPVFPVIALLPPKINSDLLWQNIAKDSLKEAGFYEVMNYSFVSGKEAEIFKYGKEELTEVENPLSLDFQYLRPSLIPGLLKNTEKNQKNFAEIKIFELGKIFQERRERLMLAGLMTGDKFYEAKGVIDSLLNKLGISEIWYDEYKATPEQSSISLWYPQRCAEIKVGQEEIGFLGEITPRVSYSMKVEKKAIVFDIDFDKASRLATEQHEYRPLSRFPSAVRDIAVLVPRSVRVEEVLNKIEIAGGAILRDTDLFDIYEGEELPEGMKNLAFHLIYQSEDRTLTSQEIDQIHQKIIKVLEKDPLWQVRK